MPFTRLMTYMMITSMVVSTSAAYIASEGTKAAVLIYQLSDKDSHFEDIEIELRKPGW